MNLHNPKLIRNIVIGSGFAMWAISIIATISFWSSLGDSAGSSGLYIATGPLNQEKAVVIQRQQASTQLATMPTVRLLKQARLTQLFTVS